MARILLLTAYSSMNRAQTGLAALTVFFCALALFMCASHSRRWRRWSSGYRSRNSDPVIQLHSHENMVFGQVEEGENSYQQVISGPIWQKNIPMGGKCQLPDFSGVIIYDSVGNNVTPAKNSRLALPWK